jgi:uncharacterized protein YbaP (TraB family)
MREIKKLVVAVMLSFVAGVAVEAQNPQQYSGALLWKISGNDLKKPSYILGTHHAVEVSFLDSIPGLYTALKAAKQVVGEVDMSNMESATLNLISYSVMPEGYSYRSLLSEEDYQLLDNVLTKRMNAGMSQMQGIRPSTLTILLTQLYCIEVFPHILNPDFEPVDRYIQTLARKQKKKIAGLETMEEQFELLYNSASIEEQTRDLLCLVKNSDEAVEQLAAVTEFYYKKQLDKLYELFQNADRATDEDDACNNLSLSSDGMNKERNDKWLKILPQIMKKNSSFVAVGAIHLAGEDGLLYKLAQMGYTVEAVNDNE